MPNLKQYVASNTLSPTNNSRSIVGGGISTQVGQQSSQGINLQAPRLQAAQTTFVPQKDILGPIIANTGEAIGKAAYKMAERQAILVAKEGEQAYTEYATGIWLGSTNADGSFTTGYASTSGKEGAEGFDPYRSQLDTRRKEIADSMGDMAKAKFLANSQYTYSAKLNQGAAHAAGSTKAWENQQIATGNNQFLQDWVPYLEQGDFEGAGNRLNDYLVSVKNDYSLAPNKLYEYQQGLFGSATDYISSRKNASASLMALDGVFQNDMGIEAKTKVNKAIFSAMDKENTAIYQADQKAHRAMSEAKEKNSRDMFNDIETGNPTMETWDGMAQTGLIPFNTYISLKNRFETKDYLPPLPPSVEMEYKTRLLDSPEESDDILTELDDYDNSSYRRISNFAVNAKDQRYNSDMRYARERLTSTIKNSMGKVPSALWQTQVTQSHIEFEKLYKTGGLSMEQMLDSVLVSRVQDYTPVARPLLMLPNGRTVDMSKVSRRQATIFTLDATNMHGVDPYEFNAQIKAYYGESK